jgi:predicted Zn-dependent protease
MPVDNLRGFDIVLRLAGAVKSLDTDLAAAEGQMRQLEGELLPQKLEGVRLLLKARVQLLRNRADDALDSLDFASRRDADMPCLDLYKAMAYNKLSHWDQALNHIRSYESLYGEDGLVCEQLGTALLGQRRLAEAAAAFRRSLNYQPKNAAAFFGLIRSLDHGARRDDLGAYFQKLDQPRANFEKCAEDRRIAHDGPTLLELALAMRLRDPDYVSAEYHLALARVWNGEFGEAAARFKSAMARESDAVKRNEYLTTFVQAMLAVNKAVDAYKAVPATEANLAFRLVAADLKKNYRHDELRQVLALHANVAGNDSQFLFYQAELFSFDGDFARAARYISKGMIRPPDPAFLAQFRFSRVQACYFTGQMMTAYKEIGPRSETFQQLAYQCFYDMKYEELQTLIDAQARLDSNLYEFLQYRFRLKIKQKQFEEASVLFKAALTKQFQHDRRRDLTYGFLRDMAEAHKALEGYQATVNKKEAFHILADELLRLHNWKELRRLLEGHRALHPDDNLLHFFTAQLFLEEKAWDKAVAAVDEFWKNIPFDQQNNYRWKCIQVYYKAGRVMQAYETFGPTESYPQLVNQLCAEKKGPELLALNAAQLRQFGESADILYHEARARVFMNRPDEALALFRRALGMQPMAEQRRIYGNTFLFDMMAIGRGLDAYRVVPDQLNAFSTLANEFTFKKDAKSLDKLLAEHDRNHRGDIMITLYEGELHLLRGEVGPAEQAFEAGLRATAVNNPWLFRNSLRKARIRAGKAVAAYKESALPLHDFEDLAHLCVNEKDAQQLEALIAARREAEPDCPHLPVWETEAKWLRGEHAAVLELLKQHREVFDWPRYRQKRGSYEVRSLIKLKKHQEAVAAAESDLEVKRGRAMLLVLAHAAAGDVKQAMAVIEKNQNQPFLVEDCYYDSELGPLLRSAPFREFADKYPPPRPGQFRDFDD